MSRRESERYARAQRLAENPADQRHRELVRGAALQAAATVLAPLIGTAAALDDSMGGELFRLARAYEDFIGQARPPT